MKKKSIIIIGFLIIIFLIISMNIITRTVTAASAVQTRNKTVTSVEIKKGDSLWSIASEYYTEECGDMKKYINEIKKSNGICSDLICYGENIIVPYYK